MNQSWLKETLQSYLRVRECDIVDKGGGQIMVVVIVGEKRKKKDHFFPRAPNNNSIYNANFAFPNHIYNNLSKFQLVLSKLIFMLVHSFQNSFFFSIYFSLLFNTVTIKKIMFYHTFFFLISHSTTSMEVKFLKHSPLIIIMDMSIIMFSSKKKSV